MPVRRADRGGDPRGIAGRRDDVGDAAGQQRL